MDSIDGPSSEPGSSSSSSSASSSSSSKAKELLDESEVVGTETDDLMTSFKGASTVPFNKSAVEILLAPINEEDVEALPGERARHLGSRQLFQWKKS